MDMQVEIALLKQEAGRAREERRMIASQIKEMTLEVKELNLSMARYRGMVGMAMIAGTLILAGLKFAASFIWK